eukprot:CAMPEP_0201582282 /NCGR_PEP_ID=MMETSP0190_2-20130828/82733_1 /ASSEMBLY_ACC=CAM_ASM_000263 /TAXON_ID=37353 /ORGANISM="Rosalina sp." /LENGTH=92 /DNA_ID=CAMNT_0048021863 /DNA_START=32 /DNA_END=310 /DNA_ORIENTATION=-
MASKQTTYEHQLIANDCTDYFDLYQSKCNQYDELMTATEKLEKAYAVLLNKKNKEILKLKDEVETLKEKLKARQENDDEYAKDKGSETSESQ